MNNLETSNNFQTASDKETDRIDYKRIMYRALRYWYVVLGSLLTALMIAFIINRYTAKIYPVTASIIIKETEETGGAGELLYQNALVSPFRNYLNELYIIKSFPLIESAIHDLNFGVAFFSEGSIITSEIYGDLPFEVNILRHGEVISFRKSLVILNDKQYKLENIDANVEPFSSKTCSFGDTVSYAGVDFVLKVRKHEELNHGLDPLIFSYSHPQLLTDAYVSNLFAVWAEKGAGVVNLSVRGLNPRKEMDFLNGLIRRYQQYDLERKNETASRTIAFITGQLQSISDSLRHVENILQRFKDKNIVTDLGSEASRVYEKLEQMELQKTEMVIRENYFRYLISYIERDQDFDQIILPSSIGLNDPILGELLTQMVTLQLEIKRIIGRNKVENPLVTERKQRLGEIRNNIIESVKNQQNTDKFRTDQINKQIREMEKQLDYLPAAERQFVSINRNYSLLENLYIFLLQKRAEAGISKASTTSDIVVVNYPMAGGAISPKPAQNYILATLLGLFVPLLLFLVMEYFNNRVQSKDDIEKLTTIPFIGGVGHKRTEDNKAVLASPKSQIAESFRALRSNLSYFTKGKNNVTILISSSISGEGKTFTTINLATVLAFSGAKTLIVGADMRRPKIFNDFKLGNSVGLSSYLAGMNIFDEIVQETDISNLDIVSGGPIPPNPSELIMGQPMADFFEQARKRYDYILIDSPPLAIVSDAFVLSEHADHILFLARQNYTPKNMLKSVNEFYQNGRIRNISIVLNDIYKSGIGYGYGSTYGYGYGYGYGYSARKNGYGYYSES